MELSDVLNIITSGGIVGTLCLGFANLYLLQKRERKAHEYSMNVMDFEKRRDYFLINMSEYIRNLDVHDLSFMAQTDEEYEGKDGEIYKKFYELETLYYKIILMLDTDNNFYQEISDVLEKTIDLAGKVKNNNSIAEFFNNGLRTPERALEISERALIMQKEKQSTSVFPNRENAATSNEKKTFDLISQAVEGRNKHLQAYLCAAEELRAQKKLLVAVAQKYLIEEKTHLMQML